MERYARGARGGGGGARAFRLFVRHCRNNIELRVKYERPRGAPPAKPFFRFAEQSQEFSLGLAFLTKSGHVSMCYIIPSR